jgi:hypothetical protein
VKILAIRYVSDSPPVVDFYAALGFPLSVKSRTGAWIELADAPAAIAVHSIAADDSSHTAGEVELAFEADEPLESVQARLHEAGFPGSAIVDESHGRSLRTVDPEGVAVQINEFDRELYL